MTDSARQTIHGCLDQEVGALAGGTRGRKLIANVCGELTKIRDGNKKPTGRHKETVAELAASQAALAALQGKLTRLVKDIEELESVKRKLADVGESSEEAKTAELLNKAKQDRESAQRYEEQLKTAFATRKLHEKDVVSAAKEVEARRLQDESILKTVSHVQALTEAEAARMVELRLAEAALIQQRELVKNSLAVFDRAVKNLQQARNVAGLALVSTNLQTYRNRLVLAEASQSRVNALVARLSSLCITEADVARIREIDTRVRRTDAVLEAHATQIVFRLLPEADGLVRMNGEPLAAASQSLIDDTSFSIEGVGEITVKPGIQDRAALLSRHDLERRELSEALQEISAESVEQAEQACAARKQCEADLANARQELASHTQADLSQKLGAGVEALRNHIAVLRARLDHGLLNASLTALPELVEAQDALEEAELRERLTNESVALARAPLQGLEHHQAEMIRAHAGVTGEMAGALDEQSRLTVTRELRLLEENTDALSERLNSTNAALLVQKSIVEAMERSRPPETVATLDSRMVRYGTALKNYAKTRQANQQRQAVLQSQIEREEGVGIEEQVAAAQQKVDSLDRECACFQHEIKVLELLLKFLEQAEHEAKERYMAPVVQRITPYLQTLFPGAAIHCDEQFKVTGIIRELQQAEFFDGLSVGTQEQIAVLTRLAFAEMLLERGKPATVILDDALVYSDPERMERMFDLLTQAAQRTQILILTCREDLFTRLGGTRLRVARG